MITVYSYVGVDQRIRMALHPMYDSAYDWTEYNERPFDFRVVYKSPFDKEWEYSCLGADCFFDGVDPPFYEAKEIAGAVVSRHGSDDEAIKWLLKGEK